MRRQLQARLARAARECYPRAAERLTLHRIVKVRFCVGPNGEAQKAAIVGGTGDDLFETAAIECVLRRAEPLPRISVCPVAPILFTNR